MLGAFTAEVGGCGQSESADGEAVKVVVRMDALFLVDRDARLKTMSSAELR